MARWLVKSDPDSYAFADLVRERRTVWDGVANAAALGHLRAMRRGDDCLIYETGKVKAVVGRAKVAATSLAAGADPRSPRVELAAGPPLARPVSLAEIKSDPAFADFALVKIGRLSVMPVSEPLWQRLLALAAS